MGRISYLLLATIFGVFGRGTTYGSPLRGGYLQGAVGCLFTRHICDLQEECIDDLLFGNCQRISEPKDLFQYQLSRNDLGFLENQIWHLIKGDYSWEDPYSQCVLQNTLLAIRRGQAFDRASCSKSKDDYTREVSSEVANVLQKLFNEYSKSYGPDLTSEEKRDEIIQVHKYFDKEPETQQKRQYESESRRGQNAFNYLNGLSPLYPDLSGSDITMDDVRALQYYLNQMNDNPGNNYDFDDNYGSVSGRYDDRVNDPKIAGDDLYEGEQWREADTPKYETGEEDVSEIPSLPPAYSNLLDKLIAGDVKPENLTTEQVTYLSDYVNARLLQSGYTPEEIEDLIGENDDADDSKKSENDVIHDNDVPLNDIKDAPITTDDEFEKKENNDDITMNKKIMGLPIVDTLMDEETKKSLENPRFEGLQHVETTTAEDGNKLFPDHYYIEVDKSMSKDTARKLIALISTTLGVVIKNVSEKADRKKLNFFVETYQKQGQNVTIVDGINGLKDAVNKELGLNILDVGMGNENMEISTNKNNDYAVLSFVLCGLIAGILLAAVSVYLIRRNARSKQKLAQLSSNSAEGAEPSKDYQDLCRQRMQSKSSEKPEPLHAASRIGSVSEQQVRSPSSRSSTSSWSEEPVTSNMDISTGHIVLSYMEDHLKNKDRLEREWEGLCSYEADPSGTTMAEDSANMRKNRYSDTVPYDHSRVILSNASNASGSDYINASTITDHDPRNPAYIATQGPLPHTVADFWQMVWEQGSVVIVMLTKLTETGEGMCHRYWPEEGSDLYHIYEVHLVSEHIWCDDYLVRSFYLKNLQTNETRTVTQFHFLTWPDLGIPSSIKALLDFRRKVNKSYRGRSCPVVVHCSDGCGRTGTYCLIDMVLNRMSKGAKEIDIAATLEHIRDQRMKMVKTKEQFQFSLAAVAEEVHAILKALPQ